MTKTFPPDWKIPIQFVWREVWLPVLIWQTQAGHLYDVFPEERRFGFSWTPFTVIWKCCQLAHFILVTSVNKHYQTKKNILLVLFSPVWRVLVLSSPAQYPSEEVSDQTEKEAQWVRQQGNQGFTSWSCISKSHLMELRQTFLSRACVICCSWKEFPM